MDETLVEAIVIENRPFSLFEQPSMRAFLQRVNPLYTPPDRHTISGTIIPRYYKALRSRILDDLRRVRYLNITFDESTNINNERTFVITITTPTRSWFLSLQNMKNRQLDADTIADEVFQQLQGLQKELKFDQDTWTNINSISTDTCSTMRKVWKSLLQKPELEHIFTIPCDSHGLQLIFKDLLGQKSQWPMIKATFKSALEIVSFFHKSPYQYADLQILQEKHYQKRLALIASVITRWGSQYNLIFSVSRSKKALIEWARSIEKQDTVRLVEVIGIILQKDFWQRLEDLVDIFEPLHVMQKASEAANANIMEVAERWIKLQKIVLEKAASSELFSEVNDYFTGNGFMDRQKKQLLPIHQVAYYLNPTRTHEEIDQRFYKDIRSILEAQKSEDGKTSAWKEFLAFRQQDDVFYKASCWQERNPYDFWVEAVSGNNLNFYKF
jgi:hypothetical protein